MDKPFQIIRNFLSADDCNEMSRRMERLLLENKYRSPDHQCRLSPAFYGIFNDQSRNSLSLLSEKIGEDLYPTYTYGRIYQEHEYLIPHFDRPEAEISLTVTLDYDKFIWPFYYQGLDGFLHEVTLDIGDAFVYKGAEISHCRHPMDGQDFQHQAFFHYVKKMGNFSHFRYDHHPEFLSSKEAEDWNYPTWNNEDFKSNPESPLNKFVKRTSRNEK